MKKAVHPEFAPRPGCRCDVCQWARRRIEQDRDLAENYQRYLDGELVSKAGKD